MTMIRVTEPTREQLDEMGVENWPIWECDVSKFDWHYDDQETCYILAGEVTVTAMDETVAFGPGDMVVFPERHGLRVGRQIPGEKALQVRLSFLTAALPCFKCGFFCHCEQSEAISFGVIPGRAKGP